MRPDERCWTPPFRDSGFKPNGAREDRLAETSHPSKHRESHQINVNRWHVICAGLGRQAGSQPGNAISHKVRPHIEADPRRGGHAIRWRRVGDLRPHARLRSSSLRHDIEGIIILHGWCLEHIDAIPRRFQRNIVGIKEGVTGRPREAGG